MKNYNSGYLFYLISIISFCFVLYFVVAKSPPIVPPQRYVYVYDEVDSKSETSSFSEEDKATDVASTSSIASTSSKNKNVPTKKYVPLESNTSSAVVSKEESTSHEVSSDTSSQDEASSEEESEVSSKKASSREPKPPEVEDTSIININTATQAELMSLPGIGEVISARIITTRDAIGGFNSIDEIMSVEGIGQKTFEKIASRLTI